MMHDSTQVQNSPAAPPTHGGVLGGGTHLPRKQAVWPTVIGIIAVIIGALGAVNNGILGPIGMVMAGAFSSLMENLAQSQPGTGAEVSTAPMEVMQDYLAANLIVMFTSAALAVMLLMGGISLLRRRPGARRTILLWAILRMVQAVPAVIVGYLQNQAIFQAIQDSNPAGGAGIPTFFLVLMRYVGPIAVVIQMLIFWALPVFALIWFNLRWVREETATWTIPNAPDGKTGG